VQNGRIIVLQGTLSAWISAGRKREPVTSKSQNAEPFVNLEKKNCR